VEELHPELPVAGAEQGLVGAEADVPIIVEAEPVERLGQLSRRRLVRYGREFPGPAHHILVTERIGRRNAGLLLSPALLVEGGQHGGCEQALQENTAGQVRHGCGAFSSEEGKWPEYNDLNMGLHPLPCTGPA
jgi:hypothetical protein